jgi:hypothetical protein
VVGRLRVIIDEDGLPRSVPDGAGRRVVLPGAVSVVEGNGHINLNGTYSTYHHYYYGRPRTAVTMAQV